MNVENIEAVVRQLLIDEFNIAAEKITATTRLAQDLALDSFDIVSLISLLEVEFNQELEKEKLLQVIAVQNIVDLIRQALMASSK